MKRIQLVLFLALMLFASRPTFAQSEEEICFSSSELLDMVAVINNSTAIGDVTFLAVVPWMFSAESQAGFYVKNKNAADDKWCLILSPGAEKGDYRPDDIMFYEEAVKYDDSPNFKGLTRAFKGKYPSGRLLVLIYSDAYGGQPFFDVYDLQLKKVISN